MANNTRVNELQEKLLQAMDILNAHALSGMSFDKTIVCTIEDDTYNKEGKYTVNDGARIFTAYSTDTKLRSKDTVYVTIPQGNFENQKMIIGKKTEETEKPFVFTTPFDTIFDMTDNIVEGQVSNGELIANALNKYGNDNYEYITVYDSPCNYHGYSRLGLKAKFKSWIKTAVRGNYGLAIVLTIANPNIASSEQFEEQEYYYNFSNENMYGNSYNFETEYEQELVIPLEEIEGTITNIKINFYQEANFFDKFNEPIQCSEKGYKLKDDGSNLYDKDIEGDYQLSEDDTLLNPNIFVNDIYLCLGYDISIFNKDMVQIYTQQSNTYKHSTSTENTGEEQNRKKIKLRWVHIQDGIPTDMLKENGVEPLYEIRWYRYEVGKAASDSYCGAYWTQIKNASGFDYDFNPNINMQQEKIKVIIIYNSNTPYRSNELIFENEEILPPSAEAQHIINALTITTNDETNGNYLVYGQDNSIKDTEYGKVSRSLSVWFDANNNGKIETNEKINEDQKMNVLWTFPAKNTMIELLDTEKWEVIVGEGDDREVVAYQTNTNEPWYKIATYYSPSKTNNTITCQYLLNDRVYVTEKEFTFGPAGTMGSEQTLVIDFSGDMNAINKSQDADENIVVEIQLYDNQNVNQSIPDGSVQWAWYYNSSLDNGEIKFPLSIGDQTNSKILFTKNQFDINGLYILQGTVGKLTTYFPIPIQCGGYSFIKGPTQVIYQADGEPSYSREGYVLYENNDPTLLEVDWQIIHKIADDDKDKEKKIRYIGTIEENTNKLQPLSIYTKDAPIYGVQALEKQTKKILWTQPILVLQNQWPNGVINAWDGKSLVLDEENSTILAASIAAGKKNSDNTFSGVMMGDWGNKDVEGSISKQTGIYGFHHGAMSYAFKEDGTAFLGKDGKGRIYIDGNEATIYSETYNSKNHGIKIDLNDPYIVLSNSYNQETIAKASTNTYPFQIGSKFKVKWDGTIYATNGEFSGHIEASSGTIGNWVISSTDDEPGKAGSLYSNDGNIVLNTQGNGSIVIGSNTTNKITIDATGAGTINMSNKSIIHGGIIEAGTLRSNTTNNKITLDGYLTVLDSEEGNASTRTFLGFVKSNTGDWATDYFSDGVGMGYGTTDNPNSILKATSTNVGLSFRNGGWISIDSGGVNIGGDEINFSEVSAENQKGIYARFA